MFFSRVTPLAKRTGYCKHHDPDREPQLGARELRALSGELLQFGGMHPLRLKRLTAQRYWLKAYRWGSLSSSR